MSERVRGNARERERDRDDGRTRRCARRRRRETLRDRNGISDKLPSRSRRHRPPPSSSSSSSHEPTDQPSNPASISPRCRHSSFLPRQSRLASPLRDEGGKSRKETGGRPGSGRRGKSRLRNEKLRDTRGSRGYVRRVQSCRSFARDFAPWIALKSPFAVSSPVFRRTSPCPPFSASFPVAGVRLSLLCAGKIDRRNARALKPVSYSCAQRERCASYRRKVFCVNKRLSLLYPS